ncbi:hypothetical protein NQ318_005835 [Aromia moschata]|uniref:[histone H3]-dimethyl-L-lysine(36) demethylase n=1 Tax=Aromia moschata TaxID=1265417 RepID=A0AAV8YS59_9CUCU|nr:hypothetical protein NQ318_005835 [Aromia moschata]
MHGNELNVAYFQRHGFNTPLLFKEKTGLGLRLPTSNFSINDVRMCVGSRRVLDVMDVNTQKNSEMTMKEWQRYYEDPDKDKLLNVISLEFSHTKLENYVQSPTVVRQVDWVDCVWPRHLKESQTEATNVLEDMKYPKVQKYCLMSVKGCYTDFHVDFGGTSVWYHILKGCKVFWLIPPTEHNLDLYERWVLSGKQSDIFFGDSVEKCARIVLHEGNTFFIPTGWIHAVFTPVDSLVFGGNFLHSYGIEKQLKIAQVEDTTKARIVPQKFRYPFFTEMLWYVLERYVHCLLGNSHLTTGQDAPIPPDRPHIHLTQAELHGLKEIVMFLHMLPANKKNVPELLKDPVSLIQDVRTLIGLHRQDSRELAITGRPILTVPEDQENRSKLISSRGPYSKGNGLNKSSKQGLFKGSKNSPPGDKGGPRRRRTSSGPGAGEADVQHAAVPAADAAGDGGLRALRPRRVDADSGHAAAEGPQRCESASNLMECSVCYEIAHPVCVQRLCPDFTGYINEDMPNSWECPMCCKLGKNTDYRPRHFRARQKSSDMRRMSISSDASSAFDNRHHQEQMSDSGSENEQAKEGGRELLPIKKRRSSEGGTETETKIAPAGDPPRKTAFRMQLAHQIASNSTKALKKPMVVVRPAPLMMLNALPTNNLALDKRCVLQVFKYLSPKDLLSCALVCKTWATYSIDPSLWKRMVFNRKHILSDILKGIVRRQPESLSLDWCHINKFQLPWLIQRLNQLRELSLVSVNVKTAISLRTNHSRCAPAARPQLHLGLQRRGAARDPRTEQRLADRPRLGEDPLRNLKTLRLAGTDITDIAMRYVTQHLPSLQHLSLGLCPRISDAGIAQLTTRPANTVTNLISLDLSHSKLVTENSLEHLSKCEQLVTLDCRHALQISTQALIKFAAKSEHNLQVRDIKLVDVRQKVQ